MPLRLSSFVMSLLTCFALPFMAVAEGLAPCPGVTLAWQCQDGTAVPVASRSGRSDPLLSYRILNAGKVFSIPRAETSAVLGGAGPVTLAGLPKDEGPCCLSQRALAPPPADLCETPISKVPSDNDVTTKENAPIPPAPPLDYVVEIEARTPCAPGATGHLCRGSLSIQRLSGQDEDRILPISITVTGASDLTLTLSGATSCNAAGANALFCQLAETGKPRFDLPLTLSAPISYQPRRVKICASLDAPSDPTQQIRLVQTALTGLGFDPGPIDGRQGPKTQLAIAALAPQLGLPDDTSALDQRFLGLLGLGSFVDSVPDNNNACTFVGLTMTERPQCHRATTVINGNDCACRYRRMIKTSETRCACVKGYSFIPGRGCVERVKRDDDRGVVKPDGVPRSTRPLQCDPASTVKRNGACVCRYTGMTQISSAKCQCKTGHPPIPGVGCP